MSIFAPVEFDGLLPSASCRAHRHTRRGVCWQLPSSWGALRDAFGGGGLGGVLRPGAIQEGLAEPVKAEADVQSATEFASVQLRAKPACPCSGSVPARSFFVACKCTQ